MNKFKKTEKKNYKLLREYNYKKNIYNTKLYNFKNNNLLKV